MPLTEAEVAVMVVLPELTPVASPLLPAALLVVAALVFVELQVAEFVRNG